MRSGSIVPALLAAALAVGCAPSKPPAPAPSARVRILAPARGATVRVPFVVRVSAIGVEVAPSTGYREPGKGHHHLFFDADLTPEDQAVSRTEQIVHLGTGDSTYTVTSLAPGRHRLILRLADGLHFPIPYVATDTVTFTVVQ